MVTVSEPHQAAWQLTSTSVSLTYQHPKVSTSSGAHTLYNRLVENGCIPAAASFVPPVALHNTEGKKRQVSVMAVSRSKRVTVQTTVVNNSPCSMLHMRRSKIPEVYLVGTRCPHRTSPQWANCRGLYQWQTEDGWSACAAGPGTTHCCYSI